MESTRTGTDNADVLLIHPGGLGDVCVSESALLSLRLFFGDRIVAVGTTRVLEQFGEYFVRIESLDSRKWGYLFSDTCCGQRWSAIIFIGKDRDHSLRCRLPQITGRFLFIDMYPDEGTIHAEGHQLDQLSVCGVTPHRKTIPLLVPGDRIMLYPEAVHEKTKWPIDRFIEVYERLNKAGFGPMLLRQPGLSLPSEDMDMPDGLADVSRLFSERGGLFFSNDSGMAHFAARCGLRTLTVFHDASPAIWKPKNGVALVGSSETLNADQVATTIISLVRGV
jgi:hypothetical protein